MAPPNTHTLGDVSEDVDGGSPGSSDDVGGLSPASSGGLDDKVQQSIANSRAESLVRSAADQIHRQTSHVCVQAALLETSSLRLQVNLEEDEIEEAALKEGEYVGVRRFTRILENGNDAKAITDRLVDICGGLVNLRTAIMRYRKPQDSLRFFRCQL